MEIASIKKDMVSLKQMMQDAQERYTQFMHSIRERITQLPDNPDAQRISPNIVIVNSSKLQDNWTAEFHNWDWQYEVLSKYLTADECTPERGIKRLEEVIRDKRVPQYVVCPGAKGYQNLHPELVKEIDKLFNGEQ